MNQQFSHSAGYLNPLLYAAGPAATFHDITVGGNGGYQAGAGWDACTGLGTPDGAALLTALTSATAASAQAGSGI
jgi:kumamolisin